jgi:chemotaxis-related protein WspB
MLLITCQAGDDRYAVEARHVSEVLPQANLERPSGSPPWLAGLLIHRGSATPVIDLTQLTRGSPCPNRLSTRILVLHAEWDGVDRRFAVLAESVGLCETVEETEEAACRFGGPVALGNLCIDARGVYQLLDPNLVMGKDRREALFPAREASP